MNMVSDPRPGTDVHMKAYGCQTALRSPVHGSRHTGEPGAGTLLLLGTM